MRQVTVVAFGTRVGGFTDPAGDDNGPGTYVLSHQLRFNEGRVRPDRPRRLHRRRRRAVRRPDRGRCAQPVRRRPDLDPALQRLPRHGTGAAGAGAARDQHGHRRAMERGRRRRRPLRPPPASTRRTATTLGRGDMLAVPQTHQIAVAVPRSALGGIDLAPPRYGIAMLGNAEAGEGIGYVRPVYDFDYWNNPPAGMELGQAVPLRRRRGRDRLRARQQGHRHARPKHDRRDRRSRPNPVAGARLARRHRLSSCRCCNSRREPPRAGPTLPSAGPAQP